MAKRKTELQEEYARAVSAAKKRMKRMSDKYGVNFDYELAKPVRVTRQAIDRLNKLRGQTLRKTATRVNTKTGEVYVPYAANKYSEEARQKRQQRRQQRRKRERGATTPIKGLPDINEEAFDKFYNHASSWVRDVIDDILRSGKTKTQIGHVLTQLYNKYDGLFDAWTYYDPDYLGTRAEILQDMKEELKISDKKFKKYVSMSEEDSALTDVSLDGTMFES